VAREHLEVELQPRTAARVGARDRERHGERAQRHWRDRLVHGLAVAGIALLVALADALHAQTPAEPLPSVILISLDGVRHDYPDRAPLPGLGRMQREGLRAERLVPPTPASTFPAHVALATGAPVDRHGIVANRFFDPGRGEFDYSNDASWIAAEPLWIAAERQGVRSAVFFWVGSETDWNGRSATHRKAPFDSRVPESAKVDQILAWLDLPEDQRPRLIMSWWHGADEAGHRHGPAAREVDLALQAQDRELARLLRELDARRVWPHTTLLVVSDHGMAEVRQSIDLLDVLRDAEIPGRVVSSEGVAYVHLDEPERAAAAARAIGRIRGVRAYPAERAPPELRLRFPGRSGHVVALTEPPRRFGARPRGSAARSEPRGAHGYAGELPEMGAIFFALGRGAPAGERLGPVRAIDVAPSVAALLGIEPPLASEGRPHLPR
jgi:predicted AlkP superfamily pyrophosphatase or phosphodiesterase